MRHLPMPSGTYVKDLHKEIHTRVAPSSTELSVKKLGNLKQCQRCQVLEHILEHFVAEALVTKRRIAISCQENYKTIDNTLAVVGTKLWVLTISNISFFSWDSVDQISVNGFAGFEVYHPTGVPSCWLRTCQFQRRSAPTCSPRGSMDHERQ